MGLDCIEWFVKQLCEIETKMHFYFQNMIKNPVEIKMTAEDEHNYNSSIICWLCNQVITPQKGKVRDHCHLTGKYRGAACSSCNLNVKQKQSSFIPVIFHNFSGYDCHLFFNELFKQKDRRKFDCIPKTDEEYISVNFGCLRFIDSYRFLQSKLAKLVESIPDTPILSNHFHVTSLLKKKLAYPYEKFKSYDSLLEPFAGLSKEDFYSTLTQSYAADEEIERTNEIIKHFNIENGLQLTELYLKTDVLLLADVFENFIKLSTKEFGINPLYCVSLPGYTWNCGLSFLEQTLDYIKDIDMLLLIENNIRGGISGVMGPRYVTSTSPAEVESGTDKKILYIDANNLYGWAMSQVLPYGEFEFVDLPQQSWGIEDILKTADDSEKGYFVEVDLEYPDSIKQKTKYFPFCPENKVIDPSKYSEYMVNTNPKSTREGSGPKSPSGEGDKTKKMICDWTNKQNYLVHYRLLKFYVRHGMVVTKVHRVIQFKQKSWLKEYIDLNTQKRAKAKTEFEKDFFKLLNNAFYGKTCENIRNRVNIEFVDKNNVDKIIKIQSKLSFNGIHKSFDTFDSFLMKKREILFDKPIYLGFSVLDLSKLLMYEFYYDVLFPYFNSDSNENLVLHYADTDSFVISVKPKTENVTQDLKKV